MGVTTLRLIDSAIEANEIESLIPMGLRKAGLEWTNVEAACFEFRADLIYFDVISSNILKFIPLILRQLEERRCFIFNYQSLLKGAMTGGSDIAIEVTADDDPETIEKELSNEGRNHHRYLSVFHLVGDFGIVSPNADWFVFARTDDRAVFSSNHEVKYSIFNKHWWTYAVEKRR